MKDDGFVQITDSAAIEESVSQAIGENPKAVNDYLQGKETAAKFLVGQVMRITRGKANPTVVTALVIEQLKDLENGNGRT